MAFGHRTCIKPSGLSYLVENRTVQVDGQTYMFLP